MGRVLEVAVAGRARGVICRVRRSFALWRVGTNFARSWTPTSTVVGVVGRDGSNITYNIGKELPGIASNVVLYTRLAAAMLPNRNCSRDSISTAVGSSSVHLCSMI